ncbi:restriction endonuclease subunit S [Glaesserella parasuis]|nr:restriction endonuclease subunit S [Glaesserella parasuis]
MGAIIGFALVTVGAEAVHWGDLSGIVGSWFVTPVVSGIIAYASDSNNGITAFIANTNASLDRNVLGVNYNGSVVENFYHPYECLFSDDVKRLKIKSERVGKYAYLFLKTVILKQKSKYQYGYKFNAERMKKQKILLPVNTDNQPDWENIERYMQQLELEKIVCYLKSKHYS